MHVYGWDPSTKRQLHFLGKNRSPRPEKVRMCGCTRDTKTTQLGRRGLERRNVITFRKDHFHGLDYKYLMLHPRKFAALLKRWIVVPVLAFFQRGRRGYADQDLWNLDSYLLRWLPDAIRQFRLTSPGHPMELTPLEWVEVLLEIETGLRKASDEDTFDQVEWEKTMALLTKWWFHLWS